MDEPASWMQFLRARQVTVEAGLTEPELAAIEERYGFVFAPVHRRFLAAGLPVGPGWVDWRRDAPDIIQDRFDRVEEGLVFDVLQNAFWPRSWGPRPSTDGAAVLAARAAIARLPRLVPIYSHRYLPAAPVPEPTPVFSVHQSDAIVYGSDLTTYLDNEFGTGRVPTTPTPVNVPFWTALVMADSAEDL